MFLKLHKIEDPEKKAFILEAFRLEFKDVVIEARKVLKRFNKIGSCNIPRFYQILGEFFFAFVLLEMIEISQGFKTF
jgi:hypothetical protein